MTGRRGALSQLLGVAITAFSLGVAAHQLHAFRGAHMTTLDGIGSSIVPRIQAACSIVSYNNSISVSGKHNSISINNCDTTGNGGIVVSGCGGAVSKNVGGGDNVTIITIVKDGKVLNKEWVNGVLKKSIDTFHTPDSSTPSIGD